MTNLTNNSFNLDSFVTDSFSVKHYKFIFEQEMERPTSILTCKLFQQLKQAYKLVDIVSNFSFSNTKEFSNRMEVLSGAIDTLFRLCLDAHELNYPDGWLPLNTFCGVKSIKIFTFTSEYVCKSLRDLGFKEFSNLLSCTIGEFFERTIMNPRFGNIVKKRNKETIPLSERVFYSMNLHYGRECQYILEECSLTKTPIFEMSIFKMIFK